MAYKDYLKSEHWKDKKKDIYNQRVYRCYFCGKRYGLTIHHITYKNIGKELLEDLIYLCYKCHKYLHSGRDEEDIQKWLQGVRSKNIHLTKKLGEKWRFLKKKKTLRRIWRRKYRNRYAKASKPKLKNYAGLFTWKAEELKKNGQL